MAERRGAGPRRAPPARAMVDSGPLIALFNAADHWHGPVLSWLREHQQTRLVTTWPVLTEVCALLARRLANAAALDFLRWIERGALELDRAEATTLLDVLAISERFAGLPFDLADASVAEAAARTEHRRGADHRHRLRRVPRPRRQTAREPAVRGSVSARR